MVNVAFPVAQAGEARQTPAPVRSSRAQFRTTPIVTDAPSTGPLAGLTVLDLSRVLAGPWSAQILGDLGADVIKVEQPGQGDDTRRWGPPFLDDGSRDSAYFLCINRNKRSIAVDMAQPEGAALIRSLAIKSDILIENFRVGGLAKYGLDYAALSAINPGLIYCSVTGFGQTGPHKNRGGYDFLIQGMSGLMSVTGLPDGEPGEGPLKVGTPTSDLSTGLYATIGILAALNHRHATGRGQHVDCALLDTQVALMANQASSFMNGGQAPRRMGNAHPSLTPYEDFAAADGEILIALGNDRQFRDLCGVLGLNALGDDDRFRDNAARNANRPELRRLLSDAIAGWKSADLLAAMDAARLPAGRVNSIPEMLADPQIEARGLRHTLDRRDGTPVEVLGFPARLSETPADYRRAPPRAGENTADVLRSILALDDTEIIRLRTLGVVAGD